MRARVKKSIAAAAAVLAASTAFFATSPGTGRAQTLSLPAFGISADGTIMAAFTTNQPQVLNWFRQISGFVGDTAAIGIDYRVQDGRMYLVGDKGGIYSVTFPPGGVGDVIVKKVSQLTVSLWGKNFGVDFNPAADRLRVISDQGQNLRHNLNDHTTVEDAVLSTPPALGPTRNVTAAAYTNNDLNPATATTLFDIDTAADQLVLQAPANNGLLAPVGSLGVDTGANAGFDVYSDLSGGKTVSNTAFATFTPPSGSPATLYSVNLFTGTTAALGQFPFPLTDIAVGLDSTP
ncbi:hypothetical protein ALI144C_40290 [Actinosynnema sp. ALI-1.44]|uniref:DUF4394 domain-containing protein n=1 Tax=Actinosynnema sp. ALI-1.44 TaxID=1933779 RepID=UPI00097BEA91|nr:DUF4394 domain-containing protein [Actinosynnema sp. ALI-1.44]ONI75011.1 hypothetical protein ALI144C_40290 [Actinosynnema sp. ALI-1.44]